MLKTNYKKLYEYCAKHLIEKKTSEERNIFNKITKNLEDKIKNALIDQNTHIILYNDKFNKNIKNILPRLKKLVAPFNINYRPKTIDEMNFIENLYEQPPYILIIDWIDFDFFYECKLHKLFNKYIIYKKYNFSLLEDNPDNLKKNYDSDNTNSSFDMMN